MRSLTAWTQERNPGGRWSIEPLFWMLSDTGECVDQTSGKMDWIFHLPSRCFYVLPPISLISFCLLDIKTADLFSTHPSRPLTTFFIWSSPVLPRFCLCSTELLTLLTVFMPQATGRWTWVFSEGNTAWQKLAVLNVVSHHFRGPSSGGKDAIKTNFWETFKGLEVHTQHRRLFPSP